MWDFDRNRETDLGRDGVDQLEWMFVSGMGVFMKGMARGRSGREGDR